MATGKRGLLGNPGGFACRVTEQDVDCGSCLSTRSLKEEWLVVKDNWCSSKYRRLYSTR